MQQTTVRGGDLTIVALLALALLATGLWPLARLFMEAFGPDEAGRSFGLLRDLGESRSVRRATWNTLSASAGSVAISCTLGVALALATGLLRLRGRAAMTFLALSPLIVPSQIMALAWIELLGSSSPVLAPLGLAPEPGRTNPLYSGPGIALLMGIEHMPLVFLAVRASLIAIPADLVEAARIQGIRPPSIVTRVILPIALPGALAGSVLAFAAAVGNFGIPALLGIPGRYTMLTTLIYQRLNGFGPSVIGSVSATALVLIALAGLALGLRAWVMRRLQVPVPPGTPFAGFDAGPARPLIETALWAVFVLLMVLPILALLGTALVPALGVPLTPATASLDNIASAATNPTIQRAFANSLVLAAGAALVSAGLAVLLAFTATIGRSAPARWLNVAADAPFVVPGTVLALAMILVYLRPLPLIGISLYGTAAILLLAYVGRFLPLVLRPVTTSMGSLDPAQDEAARLAGISRLTRMGRIAAPAVAPTIVAGAMLIFLTALNELTVSSLLWSSGTETLGVMIFALQYEGNSTGAAALSVLSLLCVVLLVAAIEVLGRRLPPETLPWRVQ